ncbi:transaldolase family protein [Propionibacteriaceae bacterium G1746]|uniref:transaldolase family protein n=1 Tax=Aestuariimicrobium sp. G57 TaxID=3418485 RepID=UPI003C16AFBB
MNTNPSLALGPILRVSSLGLPAARGDEDLVARVAACELEPHTFRLCREFATHVGVTDEFRSVVDHFGTEAGHTPAGFRVQLELGGDGVLRADLVRDIAYDADGALRPTNVLFSADTANPYELEPIAPLLANLTCNPGIIYDLFINNPQANIDHKFSTRDEVMAEVGRILGPGADISVELNNPFEKDFGLILEEAEKFREMLSKWRVVIKVPHTGPVNAGNVSQLLNGAKKLDQRWWQPATADALRGHNLALKLREHGFRVNFTLMFEPYQAQLALQAKPYFINSFVRHRLIQTRHIATLLDDHDMGGGDVTVAELRRYLVDTDNLAVTDTDYDANEVLALARRMVAYRGITATEGDGLDGARHNLRVLRQCNLPDTRLIICSMEGPTMYPDIDRLLAEPEFEDMTDRVVITAEPAYLARFTSTGQVVSYQRRFMSAAAGQH